MKKKTLQEFINNQFYEHSYFVLSFRETDGIFHKVYFRNNKKHTWLEKVYEIEKDRNRRTKNIVRFLTGLQHRHAASPKRANSIAKTRWAKNTARNFLAGLLKAPEEAKQIFIKGKAGKK